MRRNASVILMTMIMAVSLLFNGCFAEGNRFDGDFSVRGGVRFGMTREEVIAIERDANGNTEYEEKDKTIGYHVASLAGVECTGSSPTLNYEFDETTGLLNGIYYWYGYYPDGSRQFDDLYSTFAGKYGEPLHYNDGDVFPVTTHAMEIFMFYVNYGVKWGMKSYAQWLVEFDDTYVVMEVVLMDSKTTNDDELVVGFRSISREIMAEMTADAEEKAERSEQERSNDI